VSGEGGRGISSVSDFFADMMKSVFFDASLCSTAYKSHDILSQIKINF